MSICEGVHGKGFYLLRIIYRKTHNVMWFDPLYGVVMGVQHVLRLKLLLLGIFVEDVAKDAVLELAELLHGCKHGLTVSFLLIVW